MLKKYIKNKLQKKDILLMTHIVIGYPSLEVSYEIIETMVEAGVDLIELQIPFSEPIADGPVILHANQKALATGIKVEDCLNFAQKVAKRFDIPFLFMSYYNILHKYGVTKFVDKMKDYNIAGAIVPDLPPEEGCEYITSMKKNNLAPIYIYSPNSSDDRMKYLADYGDGFMYCVARKGVTGASTSFSNNLDTYLMRCKKSTNLPLALGFGVKNKDDIDYLKGKVDIAIIGSQIIRVIDDEGVTGIKKFIKSII